MYIYCINCTKLCLRTFSYNECEKMEKIMDKSISRISWIDGLRGIAALLVVFCHIACVFKYGLYSIKGANTIFEKVWLFTPLNVLTNGNTAVQF